MHRTLWLAALLAGVATGAQAAPRHAASIVRTQFGIPHISASDWRGAAYGVAYAYAQDNLCLLAEEYVTVNGERSRHFGPAGKAVVAFEPIDNLASDLFFRSQIDIAALRKGLARQPRAAVDLIDGYVAGYNRFLRDAGPQGVPAACRGKPWVRAITRDDMLRLNEKQMLLAGSLPLAAGIANAAPPAAKAVASAGPAMALPGDGETGIGSNGWAFGGDVTSDGRGLLVGNPHFPWNGPNRFWQMHVTIPGVYDVMGGGLAGTPMPTLGFNKDVAWTHTVTASRHFTLFQLTLDPADPTAYLVDGKSVKMTKTQVTVPMPDGTPPVTRTFYGSRFGALTVVPAALMGWTGKNAFAIRDANHNNQRGLATWLAIGQAKSAADIRAAVETSLGIPWVNTIAVDRAGNALLADVTAVPNVSAAHIDGCAVPATRALLASRARLVLLDGSRAACDWQVARGTPAPGLMPAADQAVVARTDYAANSNDSYWLNTPRAPYRLLSPILGPAQSLRTLRTRSGLVEIESQLAAGKLDARIARTMAFANKSLAADLVLPALLPLCVADASLADACTALAGWNRRFDNDSRGAYLFAAFWNRVEGNPAIWRTKFDVADAVNTPRDLITDGAVGETLRAALKAAVERLRTEGIALDARWGDVHFAQRGADRIPIHGAHGELGVLNVQQAVVVPGGMTPVHGTSYIQVVGFDAIGPVADALLSYSQSTNPESPHFGDQTREYAAKRWHRLPFTPAEIAAARLGPGLTITE
ncbi:MAG: penicillin acylase family protein [Alphaproteobacteria bacterium]|nr:penicillin acylase family protein [Alphaproteobacteria bacterium]